VDAGGLFPHHERTASAIDPFGLDYIGSRSAPEDSPTAALGSLKTPICLDEVDPPCAAIALGACQSSTWIGRWAGTANAPV
jgi:hypothetical protein